MRPNEVSQENTGSITERIFETKTLMIMLFIALPAFFAGQLLADLMVWFLYFWY